MMRDWPEIVRMIPTALIDEACKEIESTYFYVEPDNDDPSFYIRTAAEENISHLIHLDVRHTPHDTGKTLTAYDLRHCNITPVVTWIKIRQEDHEHADDAAEERHRHPWTDDSVCRVHGGCGHAGREEDASPRSHSISRLRPLRAPSTGPNS